jgi:acyl dehydratase
MWFEDVVIGEKVVLGDYTFTEEKIIAFAKKYDPQYFHTDPEASKNSMFGVVIASGWHTASAAIGLLVAYRERDAEKRHDDTNRYIISPGFRDLRWFRPAKPGTTLTYTWEHAGKYDWPSRPHMGLVEALCEAREPDGTLSMSFVARGLFLRKPAGG